MQNNIVNTQICMHGKYYEKDNNQDSSGFEYSFSFVKRLMIERDFLDQVIHQ